MGLQLPVLLQRTAVLAAAIVQKLPAPEAMASPWSWAGFMMLGLAVIWRALPRRR